MPFTTYNPQEQINQAGIINSWCDTAYNGGFHKQLPQIQIYGRT